MIRSIAKYSSLCALMLAASFAAAQADFSADIVDLQKNGGQASARVYFTKDKMRAEPLAAGPHGGGAVIMNFVTQTAFVIMTQQHMYMEMPAQTQTQKLGYAFFEADDVESACTYWQKSPRNQGGSCHKVGSDTVNGRSTVKFEATNANGETNHFWLDPKLRFPVKWDTKNSAGELRNIQEGAQPASLFEVPAGFTKFQMPAGMQMPGGAPQH
jgi:hypothetical protein